MGIPELEGGCHSSLGSFGYINISHSGVSHGHQNVPHASVNNYTTSPDSSGHRRPPNRTPFCSNGSFPPIPTSHSDRLNCTAPAHPRTISLHGRTIHKHVTELVFESIHGTLPAHRYLTITLTPAYTYILTTIRITPLYPVNTKHVCLLQERTPNSPTARVTTGCRH